MKYFWSVVVLLALAGAWLMWKPSGEAPAPVDPRAVAEAVNASKDERIAEAAKRVTEQAEMPKAAANDPAKALVDDLLSATPPTSPTASQASSTSSSTGNPAHAGHAGGGGAGSNVPVVTVDPASIPATTGPAKVELQDDGSFLVDDRYLIRGDGSPERPYQLTWDLLVSASKTYQPRAGLMDMPDRVKMLDGKHVRVTGYFAFPLAAQQTDEALVMMNMWDGCCIGIPPSPYDAIEVRLTEPVMLGAKRFFNYGTLDGVLKVDPYIVNDWLLGLYLVEEGKLTWGSL